MLFSIIIPAYNVEKYLRECVDSIIGQTCNDYELILVDNGSTDSSGSICDEYVSKHSNVLVKHLMPNKGISGARNEGQKLASGDYILFMDSDDYYYDNKVLERIKEKTLNAPDVILYNCVHYFEKTGTLVSTGLNMKVEVENRSVLDICRELIDKDVYSNSAWSKAIKRSLLEDNNIHFTTGIAIEDNDWYYKVILHVKSIAIIEDPIYVYRRRSDSVTATADLKHTIDNLSIIEKWTEIVKKEKENPNSEIITLSLAKQYCNYMIGYSSQQPDYKVTEKFKHFSYLLNYSKNKRVVTFRRLKTIFGIKGLLILLKLYKKIK